MFTRKRLFDSVLGVNPVFWMVCGILHFERSARIQEHTKERENSA